jgi:hypothetical protein
MGESMRGGGVDDGAPDEVAVSADGSVFDGELVEPVGSVESVDQVSAEDPGGLVDPVVAVSVDGSVLDGEPVEPVESVELVGSVDQVSAEDPGGLVDPVAEFSVEGSVLDAAAAEPGTRVEPVEDPPRARNRWNVVLAVACVVLLLGAGGVALRNRSVRDDAASRRAEAAELDGQRDELAAVSNRMVDHDNVVDLEREAVGKSNDGALQAAKDLFGAKGPALLDALAQAATFLATERDQLDADIAHLKESAGA